MLPTLTNSSSHNRRSLLILLNAIITTINGNVSRVMKKSRILLITIKDKFYFPLFYG